MEKDKLQADLYEHFLSFFLPEGMLDFFDLVWAESKPICGRESQKEVVYTGTLHMYLDERDNRTEDMQEYRPNGFTEESVFSDFPVRDKKFVLHVRRRRWLTPEGKSVIMNVYPLVAAGTRYSAEFAAFLKESLGYDPGDSTLPW